MTKAAYVGVKDTLPDGYTKLEYVESNGAQYIDTGYAQKSAYVMEIDVTYVTLPTSSQVAIWESVFGTYCESISSMALSTYGGTTYVYFAEENAELEYEMVDGVEYTVNMALADGNCNITVNGNTTTFPYGTELITGYNMYLFANNMDEQAGELATCRIKHFAYKDDGKLVRNYIPVLNPSGVSGMFDTIEQKFYPSSNSTALIAGPTVSSGSASVARKIKKGYIGIAKTYVNLTGDPTTLEYSPIFCNNTWRHIIAACQRREVPDTWHVGDRKDMTINGADYSIIIIGKNHDTYSDGSGTAPLTFQLDNVYGTKYAMNTTATNTGGWRDCAARNTHLPAILELMPSEVKSGIKEVSKKTCAGQYNISDYTIATTADKLFLLSEVEIFGKCTYSVAGEGSQYSYYAAGSSVLKNGSWYERSPCTSTNATHFGLVYNGKANFNNCTSPFGFSFAFCFGGTSEASFSGSVSNDSIARKIKKAYIGIGGVARPFWGGGELAYYGTATALSQPRNRLVATSVGDYAIFGGGEPNSAVDAYDTSLTVSNPTTLKTARSRLAATSVGNYALFGGGYTGYVSSVVDAYNTSLTRSTPSSLYYGRQYLAATSIGNYALFGGGYGSSLNASVDAYNTSLTRSTPTGLSVARYYLSATSVGNYALFGGGYVTGYVNEAKNTVDAYNTSLTRSTPTSLSVGRFQLAATSVGNYALFGGGSTSSSSAVVDAYNESLTRSIPTSLNWGRYDLAATLVGGYALFGGGYTSNHTNVVDAYDESLTRSSPTKLSAIRSMLAATTVGNYALFGGGWSSTVTNVVDVYTIA